MEQQLCSHPGQSLCPAQAGQGLPLGPAGRDGESGAGDVPAMKGNDKNKSLPKTSQSGFDCTGEGSSSGSGCKGKRTGASS